MIIIEIKGKSVLLKWEKRLFGVEKVDLAMPQPYYAIVRERKRECYISWVESAVESGLFKLSSDDSWEPMIWW